MTPTELAALHALCFTTPRPWHAPEFASLLDSQHTILCEAGLCEAGLCEAGNGFLLGRITGPEAEILTLAVHPRARRTGIARTLLDEFEQTAHARGALQVFLEVSTRNTGAIALYHKAGYKKTGLRRNYYQTPDGATCAAHIMARALGVDQHNGQTDSSGWPASTFPADNHPEN